MMECRPIRRESDGGKAFLSEWLKSGEGEFREHMSLLPSIFRTFEPGRDAVHERIGYLAQHREQLYYVLHRPRQGRFATRRAAPLGQVLVAGHYGPGSLHTYPTLVRWARLLAQAGIEVMRFDYRGTGESTGDLAKLDFNSWEADLTRCATWLRARGRGLPLILHGFGLGAVLAARAFDRGLGDGLLCWSPPASARVVLMCALMVRQTEDFALRRTPRRTRKDYIAQLEAGETLDVEGYPITPSLWRQSADVLFPRPEAAAEAPPGTERPWKVSIPDESAGPLRLAWRLSLEDPLNVGLLAPKLDRFFAGHVKWMRGVFRDHRSHHAKTSAA
jgi:hypothetical protein